MTHPARWPVLNWAVDIAWVFLALAVLVFAGTMWRDRVQDNVPPCAGPVAENPFTQGE